MEPIREDTEQVMQQPSEKTKEVIAVAISLHQEGGIGTETLHLLVSRCRDGYFLYAEHLLKGAAKGKTP